MSEYRGIHQIVTDPDNPVELLLDLGPELCKKLDWQPGDILEWTDNKDGTWQLQKSKSVTP
jgi:hypothetical protein